MHKSAVAYLLLFIRLLAQLRVSEKMDDFAPYS